MRILYIHSTLVPPPLDPQMDRFFLLSKVLEGDVVQPIWCKSPEEVEAALGPGSYPAYTSGNFRYHWFLAYRHKGLRGRMAQFWFYLRKGIQLHRQKPFDCVVTYSHMTTALTGLVVKLLTGTKLIVEIVTSPQLVYLTHQPHPSPVERVMKLYSDVCLHLSLWFGNRAHLLFPGQLNAYPRLKRVRRSIFHEFVPVSRVPPHRDCEERYILMVGAPWYLKGVDRLAEAFHKLAPDFPNVKLKLLGWYADREKWEALAQGSAQIELLRARPNPEALEIISRCEVLVQPSRCEGLPRILVEGLATGVPVVGSDVGGIPYLVRDGENGFVVPGGDPHGLEARMRQLLEDPALRRRMGAKGFERAHREFTEERYVQQFRDMVAATIEGRE